MLERSDTSVAETLKQFNAWGLDVGFLVPTETGLRKSILDATANVRQYFSDLGYHDYDAQPVGAGGKVVRRAVFLHADRIEETSVSLYRPETKSGDPRIWFGKLGSYAGPYNLIALLIHDGCLHLVNCSRPDIVASLRDPATPLGSIARSSSKRSDPYASELLSLIKAISRRGFVPTLRPGDTGVGMTLETLLGIAANTSKQPDFKGIEIKAGRMRGRGKKRDQLFSQVPDWSLSPVGSAWGLLSGYGYRRSGQLRLYHTNSVVAPNSLGFQLEVDAHNDWLRQNHIASGGGTKKHLVTWKMGMLRKRLLEKHPQTFWVGALCRGKGAGEEFHYTRVEHTRAPRVRDFELLLESGAITVDYTMSQKDPSRPVVNDHGYLFKIRPEDFGALFPRVGIHDFSA